MQGPIRADTVLSIALAALHSSGTPALAQSAAMPAPGVAASSPPDLAVDPMLWSLETSDVHEAILTFDHQPGAVEISAIEGAGVVAHRYHALPMVAVQGTATQLRGLLGLSGLRSIFIDRRLESYPDEAELAAQGALPFATLE
jgi:hypothetical protein